MVQRFGKVMEVLTYECDVRRFDDDVSPTTPIAIPTLAVARAPGKSSLRLKPP
jgi:hypothetical protein